jgi:hypothetical protein
MFANRSNQIENLENFLSRSVLAEDYGGIKKRINKPPVVVAGKLGGWEARMYRLKASSKLIIPGSTFQIKSRCLRH